MINKRIRSNNLLRASYKAFPQDGEYWTSIRRQYEEIKTDGYTSQFIYRPPQNCEPIAMPQKISYRFGDFATKKSYRWFRKMRRKGMINHLNPNGMPKFHILNDQWFKSFQAGFNVSVGGQGE
jgi:hypothetical protein